MTRILIVGSCVTRDAFEVPEAQPLSLADYYARTSLASAFGQRPFPAVDLTPIPSAFQRRMVERDHTKALPSRILRDDYDLVVYDPIDERFDLLRAPDGSLATYSAELAGAVPDTSTWERVKSGTDAFFELWVRGWARFMETLDSGSRRGLLRVNRVYWSERTASGEDFAPKHSSDSIQRANRFLDRLYERMEQDLLPEQFVTYDRQQLVAADEHKWGRSPFHFTNEYYQALLRPLVEPTLVLRDAVPEGTPERLADVRAQLSAALAEREVVIRRVIAAHAGCWAEETGVRERDVDTWTNGTLELASTATASFVGDDGSYELRVGLGRPLVGADGMTVRIRIAGWSTIRYVAIGHTTSGFRHVKIPNPPTDEWFTFSFGYGDLIDRLQNKDAPVGAATVRDIRIYVRGTPGHRAVVDLDWAAAWSRGRASAAPGPSLTGCTPSSAAAAEAVMAYLLQRNPLIEHQVARFERTGEFPVSGEKFLPWPPGERRPPALDEVGTYGHVWHSQHLAGGLLTMGRSERVGPRTAAARELVSAWLDDNFYAPGDGSRYIWYDHAVAERTLVLLLMHEVAVRNSHDARFVARLESAIVAHAQLLESEAFYAAQQPSRFHNHAWFQDVALLAVGVFLDGHPASRRWRTRPLERLERQFEELIAVDGDYAVFVENSTGYHIGIQSLASFADSLARICDAESVTATVAQGMRNWAELIRYPDGRVPAHGDTFRLPNPQERGAAREAGPSRFAALPNAGYAVVHGRDDGLPWMLTVIASARSATHKHEDNLSVTLWADGVEWLIDPSFFSHEYSHPVPDRLRRARSHTVPWLDGAEYSTAPGRATIMGDLCEDGTFVVDGAHRGYEGFEVRRRIEGAVGRLALQVRDAVESVNRSPDGESIVVRNTFHLGDGVTAEPVSDGVLLHHPASGMQLRLEFEGAAEIRTLTGSVLNDAEGSVSGTGFMETVATTSLEVMWQGSELRWSLGAADAARP